MTKFDEPSHVWVVEFHDPDISSAEEDIDAFTVFEYDDNPLTEADVLEELRYSYTVFEDNKDQSLEDLGIKVISIVREQC